MTSSIRALIFGTTRHRTPALTTLGTQLAAQKGIEPIVVMREEWPDEFKAAKERGLHVEFLRNPLLESAESGIPSQGRNQLAGVGTAAKRRVAPIHEIRRLATTYRVARAELRAATQLLDKVRPKTVLLADDRAFLGVVGLGLAAQRRQLPIVLPFLTNGAFEYGLEKRKLRDANRYHGILWRIVRMLCPEVHEDGICWYPDPAQVLVMKSLGVLNKNPWMPGGGISTVVMVDSKQTHERFAKRVLARKLKILGSGELDAVWKAHSNKEEVRHQLCKNFEWPLALPIVVVAVPQYGEHRQLPWPEHWEAIGRLISALHDENRCIALSLHPRSLRADYQRFESRRCRICTQPLREVLPVGDVFVTDNSSTSAWALMCGIPCVSTSVVIPPAQWLREFENIVFVESYDELSAMVGSVLKSQQLDFTRDWELLSRKDVFDGNSTARVAALLHSLADRTREMRPNSPPCRFNK